MPLLPPTEGSSPVLIFQNNPIIQQHPPLPKKEVLPWIMTGISMLILVLYKNRKIWKPAAKPEPILTSQELLKQLQENKLSSKGNFNAFFNEVVEVVRHDITLKSKLPLKAETSQELLKTIKEGKFFNPSHFDQLKVTLETADSVKFGKHASSKEECDAIFEMVSSALQSNQQATISHEATNSP